MREMVHWDAQLLVVALIALMVGLGLPSLARAEEFGMAWNRPRQQQGLLRDKYVDARTEPGTLQLRRRVLLYDEIGRTDLHVGLTVTDQIWAKKEFLLDSPKAFRAYLTAYHIAIADNAELSVNGRLVAGEFAPPSPEVHFGRFWPVVEVPVEYLRPGLNEFILRPKPGKSFGLFVEPSISPDRSSVSRDGGATWDYEALDDAGFVDGEFMVRLDLERYPAEGKVWSPPVDLAAMAGPGRIAPLILVKSLSLQPEVELPSGTSIRYELRAGSTPDFDVNNWSPWKEVAPNTPISDLGVSAPRYAQWRATLCSRDPLTTPKLRSVRLALDADIQAQPQGIEVASWQNEEIVRSSYHFTYLPPGGRTELLRTLHKLDDVVAPAKSEFEKYLLMRQWGRNQWLNGWNKGKLQYIPPWDAVLILDLAGEKDSLGMCTHYGTVFTQCASAVGLIARSFIRGHFINEVWSNEYKKWVCMDMGGDTDDTLKRTLHYVRDGIPLSGLEIHRAYLNNEGDQLQIVPESSASLYGEGKGLDGFAHFFIPLRNNHLIEIEPEEPEHGESDFRFIGHLWWVDDRTQPMVWTDICTDRQADFYPTLNQAEMHLQVGAEPGQLLVELDTQTPNFQAFQGRFDSGEWTEVKGSFVWALHSGENRLEVRPVNAWGLPGIVSAAVIRYAPAGS